MSSSHPMQYMVVDSAGVVRFKRNEIVRFLLDHGPFDMNKIAAMGFSKKDQAQFAQLIGYSVSGWGELDYVSSRAAGRADEKAAEVLARWQWRREKKG